MIGHNNITHIRYTIRMLRVCELELESMLEGFQTNKKYNVLSDDFKKGAVLGMRNSLKVIRNQIKSEEYAGNNVGR